MFYIESGTGKQIDASNLAGIDPSKTYYASGTGQTISGSQLLASSRSASVVTPATTSTPTASSTPQQAQLDALLTNPNLSEDQKSVIRSIYGAVTTNDTSKASQITAAMQAASQYSGPYFKAQIRLVTDALQRGLTAKDGDLAYQESSLSGALDALRQDTMASKDQLSLDHAQELKGLADKYTTDLDDTRTNLAATGFTDSSKRARSEEILNNNNNGLVETSNRNFSYQTGQLDRTLGAKTTDTAAQIANLQRLTDAGNLDLTRTAEGQVGSTALSDLGYSTLGNVPGTIPYNQSKDTLSFANNFVL